MFIKAQFVRVILIAIICLLGVGITNSPAAINDHFDNGVLDPAWNIVYQNTTGWNYTETGTNLTVTNIGVLSGGSDILVSQNFSAPGDFEIKSGISWNSESTLTTMQTLGIRTYCGSKIVTEVGYTDYWRTNNGQMYARIEYPDYYLDSGRNTVPSSAAVDVTLKRTNGSVSVLWNNDVILTGFSNLAVDKIEFFFGRYADAGANFGVLSVDYVTAVPEPATICLLGIAGLMLRHRRAA